MAQEYPLVSVVLPVYNGEKYLKLAIESVLAQTYHNWELVISDDGSSQPTLNLLNRYESHPQVVINYNSKNIGLFANLNLGINCASADLVMILCSDDYLLPECLAINLDLYVEHNFPSLLLSSFIYIDQEGKVLKKPPYPLCAQSTRLWQSREVIPLLLEYGSINGNISGMFFPKQTFKAVGEFRSDWNHAADWEWLYRVGKFGSILMSRQDVVAIRSHAEQLSGINFHNLSNSLEVVEMVRILLNDPVNQEIAQAQSWALHILQFHLWFALKFWRRGERQKATRIVQAIARVMPLGAVTWQMVRWLPTRWQLARG
ncbi:MAG: glycosyltransferase [Pseudanabaenaceae cyanobacterium bins.68]|nr:glycosyltransferase [Pseudanabaenaceae cyanobacterium bins.68]